MRHLMETAAAWLAERPEEPCRRAAAAMQVERAQRPIAPVASETASRDLAAMVAQPEGALMEAFARAMPAFAWREPPQKDVGNHLVGRSAGNVIIGPEGTFPAQDLRFGAFVISAHTVYLLHAHAAEELYIVIGGAGHWWIADEPYAPRGPGDVVHIPSWTPHAIRTDDEPVLTLWVWMGDVSFDAYRFEPAGFDGEGHPI